jgi:DNA replication protein
MTSKFNGFPRSNGKTTALPSVFFSELLPQIDDLAELKLTLFCFRALYQKEGRFRYLRRRDFLNDEELLLSMATCAPDSTPKETLDAALESACERGTVLCAAVKVNGSEEFLYFMNTPIGRAAVDQIQLGEWQPADLENPTEILPERPNIFQLYEENIGPLTPLIADALKEAQRDYPSHWIDDAIRLAVESNARSWRYILKVLEGWRKEGKSREKFERSSQKSDGSRYLTGKYSEYIKR